MQCWNATEAAKKAGYSERTAGAIGAENLKKPKIADEIARRVSDEVMNAEEVLINLSEIAHASVEDFMDIDDMGKMKFNFKRCQEHGKLNLIKSISPTAKPQKRG